ncbi:MAG TPA: hypothetical protein PKI03_23350 [Pseudomonadota bacterium]|nr:hypothetical protein [Pseudomonadota bacterium]
MRHQAKTLLCAGLLCLGPLACKRPSPPAPVPPVAPTAPAAAGSQAAAVPGGPKVAAQENRRGMKAYRAKDYAGAAAAFRAAIAADASHVLAHYNLACVLALTGDKAGAVTMLEWLHSSSDPQAARCLTKAAVDRDLTTVRGDPKVQSMLAAAAEKAAAAIPSDDKLLPPLPPLVQEVQASSTATDSKHPARYAAATPLFYVEKGGGPDSADDPAYSTRWCEGRADEGIGESLSFTLSSPTVVDALRIAAGVWESPALFKRHNRITRLEVVIDGQPTQTVSVPAGRKFAEISLGKRPLKSAQIRIAAVEKGQDNLSCLSAVQLLRDRIPLAPLDVAANPTLAELPGALLAIQKALRSPGKDFAKLDSLLSFPFATSDGSCFLSMECDANKKVTHKTLPELAKACHRYEKLDEEKRRNEGNPCPFSASVDGEDDRPLGIAQNGTGEVTLSFPSHNEVCTEWTVVHRDSNWRLAEIGFSAGSGDGEE